MRKIMAAPLYWQLACVIHLANPFSHIISAEQMTGWMVGVCT